MRQELMALRAEMTKQGIDAYIIPTDDYHGSEYVGEHFKSREFVSGFTGSAGTLLVTQTMAGLWTDGRYFIQAARQLEGSGIDLYKAMPGLPTITQTLSNIFPGNFVLGYDGRTMTAVTANHYKKSLPNATFKTDLDLPGKIWENRPPLPQNPARLLRDELAGESREEKIKRFREKIEKLGGDTFILSHLPDIMWLLNIRGDDIKCCPVVLSYCVVSLADVLLFADSTKLSADDISSLKKDGVTVLPYNSIYGYLKVLKGNTVLYDETTLNSALHDTITSNENIKSKNVSCPITLMRCVKNPTEIENIKRAHIEDGKAINSLLSWLRSRQTKDLQDGKAPVLLDDDGSIITELSVCSKIEQLRRLSPLYIGPSFDTIVGYADHGAIIHYSPTPETDIPLRAEGFVLIDTGGQYEGGTTDITRTVALGSLSAEMQKCYDAVMQGHKALLNAKFPRGTNGAQLDSIARYPVWQAGYDYNHGTGHGVGYMLNVHECPPNIRKGGTTASIPFEPGMICSDEPGIYVEGKFGIRTENMVLCVEDTDGMLRFESLTTADY